MASPLTLSDLTQRRSEIQAQLAGLGPMRPGTLAQRFRKCGKPNCSCAREGARGHGPVWVLTWAVEGKTQTRVIPEEAVEDVRAQVAEYQRCRTLTRALVEVSTRMCDVHLEEVKGAKKKPSSRRSNRPVAARPKPRSSA